MFEFAGIDSGWLIVFGLVSVATFVLSLILVPVIIVRIPETYFTRNNSNTRWNEMNPVVRGILTILKNVLGLILLVMGILMLVLPGQGLLTILFGIALIDFPGKHKLVLRLVAYPKVLNSLNWIRKKANKNPLLVD